MVDNGIAYDLNHIFSIICVFLFIQNSKFKPIAMNNAELDKLRASTAKKHEHIHYLLNQPCAHRLNGLIFYEINCKFSKFILFQSVCVQSFYKKILNCVCLFFFQRVMQNALEMVNIVPKLETDTISPASRTQYSRDIVSVFNFDTILCRRVRCML